MNHNFYKRYRLEMIKCCHCDIIQAAAVELSEPFDIYVHDCVNCGYTIMESEWDVVPPFKFDMEVKIK